MEKRNESELCRYRKFADNPVAVLNDVRKVLHFGVKCGILYLVFRSRKHPNESRSNQLLELKADQT